MSKEITKDLDGNRPFEERVFARFDAVDEYLRGLDARVQNLDARVQNLDARVQVLESRAYDTKPIWEKALKEIVDTREELKDFKRQTADRLDQIQMVVLETRVGLRSAQDRLDK